MAGRQLSANDVKRTYLFTALGLSIMLTFPLLPVPEPITPTGWALIGLFVGMVILWSFVDLVWPTFIAVVMFGLIAQDIYPHSFQRAGIYEAGMQSFGNWIVIFVLGCLILTAALHKAGTIRRIAFWFLSRDVATKGLWNFTFMLLLATLVVGCFVDVLPVQIFMLGIAYEIFEDLGYEEGDAWPKLVVIGITFSSIISFAMTPISHPVPLLFLGVLSGISGEPVNLFLYMLVGVPLGLAIFMLMAAWFRYFFPLRESDFRKFNLDRIESMKPAPMDLREKLIVAVCVVVLMTWILPGIIMLAAPDSALNAITSKAGIVAPLFVAIALLGLVHIDGNPLVNLKSTLSELEWTPIIFLAAVIMVAGAMGQQTTGIPDWMKVNLVPLLDGLGPYAIIATIAVLCCVMTNFANNVAVGIVFIVTATPLALSNGMDPLYVGMAVCIGANLAFTIPPSFVPVGIAYASPWNSAGVMFRNGFAVMLISCLVLALLVYPISSLVFG